MFKDTFKVMAHPKEDGKYVIIHANHLASSQIFDSYEEANKQLENTNWDLVASLVCSITEAILTEKGLIENSELKINKKKRTDRFVGKPAEPKLLEGEK